MMEYKDFCLKINNQDRIVSGKDIPLILKGQARPLRTVLREAVVVRFSICDLVQTDGAEIVFMVGMMEVSRMLRSEFMKKAAVV